MHTIVLRHATARGAIGLLRIAVDVHSDTFPTFYRRHARRIRRLPCAATLL